jgi:rare lipoprotein A (peptidoglycan hydrolase)
MFLALHRTAPVGTIMQVRNQMNDLSVFVKVIGKLPDTGANDKVIVKLSKKAYERLAALDKRFRVELSYMP